MKPLYHEIADDILSKIESGEYAEGHRLQVEMELMEKYGVSRVTIRKAMDILVDKDKIYRISGKGTFVGTQKNNASKNIKRKFIGVILCNFTASYGTELLKSLEESITDNGYLMVFMNSHYDRETETSAIKTLIEAGAAGIIIQPLHNQIFNSELMKLSLRDFPLVVLDRTLQGLPLPFVGSDNSAAITEAMTFLFKKGHKNICMFTPVPSDTATIEERIMAFIRSFMNNDVVKSYNIFNQIESPLKNNPTTQDINRDIAAIQKKLEQNPQITCAFASEYSVARMIRSAAKNMNKEIPGDLSLITFDNHNDCFRGNSTTFIRQRENEIAAKAVQVMLSLFEKKNDTGKYLIQTDIIDNGSVKDINNL